MQTGLGCPRDSEIAMPAAEQSFQGGLMYWAGLTGRIYVLRANGTWSSFPDTYAEGEVLDPIEVPLGCHEVVRGFGKLWRSDEDVRRSVSCALAPEVGMTGVYQRFAKGAMLYSQGVNGHGRQIYVLFADGTYRTYVDPNGGS